MDARLSPGLIGKRILELRKLKGFSQEDLAKFLENPRSSVAQMELGRRNVSIMELIQLSELLGFSLDKFLAKDFRAMEKLNPENAKTSVKTEARIAVPELKSTGLRISCYTS